MSTTTAGSIARAPRPSSLADVLDLILDKGLVIDAYIRISAVGIEVLTIDARIVIASVDTYLHYAEAVNRLDLSQTETQGITGLFGDDSASDGSNGSSAGANGSSGGSTGSGRGGSRSSAGGGSGADRGSSGRVLRGGDERPAPGRSRQNGDSDEGEGKGRALTRRLSEKGKWNS